MYHRAFSAIKNYIPNHNAKFQNISCIPFFVLRDNPNIFSDNVNEILIKLDIFNVTKMRYWFVSVIDFSIAANVSD